MNRFVADLLQVHVSTVSRWASRGLLRSLRIGERTVRFRPEDVEAFLETHRAAEAAS